MTIPIILLILSIIALCGAVFAVLAASDDIERLFEEIPENDNE